VLEVQQNPLLAPDDTGTTGQFAERLLAYDVSQIVGKLSRFREQPERVGHRCDAYLGPPDGMPSSFRR
jgi:hypothetical protein